MSIFDIEDKPEKITRDDLLKDHWQPDRLGRVWTRRLRVCREGSNSCMYLYLKYTFRNPHTKKKYTLELINPEVILDTNFNPVFNNIRTLYDLNICILSMANKWSTNISIDWRR